MLAGLQQQIRADQGPGAMKISEISHNIYICPRADIKSLGDYDITRVLQLLPEEVPLAGVKTIFMPTTGQTNLPKVHGEAIYNLLQSCAAAESKIAVMCTDSNTQAVVAVAIYYLRRSYALFFMSDGDHTRNILNGDHTYLPRIIKFIQKSRSCIMPSDAQLRDLITYERWIKDRYGSQFLAMYGERTAGWLETQGDPPTPEEFLREIFAPPPLKPTPMLPSDDLDEIAELILATQ